MIQTTTPFVALMFLMGKITPSEADAIEKELQGRQIARSWVELLNQVQGIIKRPIEINDRPRN